MVDITVRHINAVHLQVEAEPHIIAELSDHFSFEAPGAQFSPAFKRKKWDGKIRLFDRLHSRLYTGLRGHLQAFCGQRAYTLAGNEENPSAGFLLSPGAIQEFVDGLGLPFQPHDYQIEAFRSAVFKGRGVFISPTSSGKSLIQYMLTRYYLSRGIGRVLIVVPTTGLVSQMIGDFVSYGATESVMRKVEVRNWQAIVDNEPEYFEQFGMVVVDECHLATSKSLIKIMVSLKDCLYRFGVTGTLSDSKTNKLVLEGLFGAVETVTTTAELMEAGHVSPLRVNVLVLKHPPEASQALQKRIRALKKEAEQAGKPVGSIGFQEEVATLVKCHARNVFLANLALKLEGNTLLMFHRLEHGQAIKAEIESRNSGRPVYLIDGDVSGEERDDVRGIVEQHTDAILLGSTGVASTGINIRNIENIIQASSWKSRIINLQSIGRGLRKFEGKVECVVYDIVDDMQWKSVENHALKHSVERIKIYCSEMFAYKMVKLNLNY